LENVKGGRKTTQGERVKFGDLKVAVKQQLCPA